MTVVAVVVAVMREIKKKEIWSIWK
jgi:hypothetical protein